MRFAVTKIVKSAENLRVEQQKNKHFTEDEYVRTTNMHMHLNLFYSSGKRAGIVGVLHGITHSERTYV